MTLIASSTIVATGDTNVFLFNKRGKDRQVYSAGLSGNFGGGTITAFLCCDGSNNIPIKDNSGNAISITSNDGFNFEFNSDALDPVKLVITLTGGSSHSINMRIYDNK